MALFKVAILIQCLKRRQLYILFFQVHENFHTSLILIAIDPLQLTHFIRHISVRQMQV